MRLFHEDLQDLKRIIGLDGIVICQSFRVSHPSGLAMAALADALWNPNVPWDEMRREHLEVAYGEHAGDKTQRKSLDLLFRHIKLLQFIVRAYRARLAGDEEVEPYEKVSCEKSTQFKWRYGQLASVKHREKGYDQLRKPLVL